MTRARRLLLPAALAGGAAGAVALARRSDDLSGAARSAATSAGLLQERPTGERRTPPAAQDLAAQDGASRASDARGSGEQHGDEQSSEEHDGDQPTTSTTERETTTVQQQDETARTQERHPGAEADSPREIPAAGWKQVVKRSWREQKDDNVPLLAAGVAFWAFIALFPALIALISLYGLIASPEDVERQVEALSDSLPSEAATLLQQQLTSIASGSDDALGIGLAISVLAALFAASGGVQNLMKAVNVAYDEDESRGFLKLRGTAFLLTLGAIVFVVVAVALVAVLPAVLSAVGLGSFATIAISIGRYVGLFLFVMAALAIVYRFAPDRDDPRFAWTSLGAAVATVLWVIGSIGFSLYVSNFGSYGETYGALAGVVILLLWLFLTSFIVLLGAEVNAEAEKQTERDTTTGEPQPLGERGAVAADEAAPYPAER